MRAQHHGYWGMSSWNLRIVRMRRPYNFQMKNRSQIQDWESTASDQQPREVEDHGMMPSKFWRNYLYQDIFRHNVVSKYCLPAHFFQEATREYSLPNAGVRKPTRETHGTQATGEGQREPPGSEVTGALWFSRYKRPRCKLKQVGKCWERLL